MSDSSLNLKDAIASLQSKSGDVTISFKSTSVGCLVCDRVIAAFPANCDTNELIAAAARFRGRSLKIELWNDAGTPALVRAFVDVATSNPRVVALDFCGSAAASFDDELLTRLLKLTLTHLRGVLLDGETSVRRTS
jgi:hypothetical protein